MLIDLVKLETWLDNTSFLILFLSMLVYWIGAALPSQSWLNNIGTILVAIANLCIAALLGARWLEAGYFPLSNLYESLFFLAWGVTLVHLLTEKWSLSRLVGVFTTPVAMGITAFAALSLPAEMQASEPLVPALKSNWLMMHVSVMMLSYAALIVGSLVAIAFLIFTRGEDVSLRGSSVGTGSYRQSPLKTVNEFKNVSTDNYVSNSGVAVQTLTPVKATENTISLTPEKLSLADTLDNISYRVIGLGFPLLTIGIISGAVWANEAWGSYWSWDPKETWALITWLVFAAYLHARITRGWQGKKPAILAATGFMMVWICYLGVNLLGKGLHSYGWFF